MLNGYTWDFEPYFVRLGLIRLILVLRSSRIANEIFWEGNQAPVSVECPLFECLRSLRWLLRASIHLGTDPLLDDEFPRLLIGFQGLVRSKLLLV